MAVVIETTLGDITVDLFLEQRPRTCLNFLKLCKLKYYNFNLFHMIQPGFIAQTGDPTGEGTGGQSIWGVIEGSHKSYFQAEKMPKMRHIEPGTLSMVTTDDGMVGSQFFLTLSEDLNSLDSKHCVIGVVTEGHDILRLLNETICDSNHRPYQDVRITHTVVLDDPFEDPKGLREPSRSPSPTAERLAGGRIAPDEVIDEMKGKTEDEIREMIEEREAKARATILEIVGDIPDADVAPPENVLFVCKLNPVTNDDDLEIIFSRFGKIKCCEVIRDKKSGDSLQYAFIEFEEQKSCEDAYFKMDNVLIDDRRIHVDFSQSVSKIKWRGKGRGVIIKSEDDIKNENKSSNDTDKNNGSNRYDDRRRPYDSERRQHVSNNERRRERSGDRDRRRNDDRSRHDDRDNRRRRSPERERKDERQSKVDRHHSDDRRRYYDRSESSKYRDTKRSSDGRRNRDDERYGNRNDDERYKRSHENTASRNYNNGKHTERNDKSDRTKNPDRQTVTSRKLDSSTKNRSECKRKKDIKSKKSKRSKSSDSDSDSSEDSSEDEKKKRSSKRPSKKSKKKSSSSSSSSDSSSSDSSSDSDERSKKKSKKRKKDKKK